MAKFSFGKLFSVAVKLKGEDVNKALKDVERVSVRFVYKYAFMYCLILVIVLASCSKEKTEELSNILGAPDDGNVYISGTLANDFVEIWDKEYQIIADDYYSKIDTVLKSDSIARSINYAIGVNETGSVKWNIGGSGYNGIEKKKWDGNIQKWVITNTVYFDVSKISSNLRIEAIVNLNGKSIRRLKTIPEIIVKKNTGDILGYTFGTKRVDMQVDRDFSSTMSQINMISMYGSPTYISCLLGFSNGLLSSLIFIPSASTASIDNIVNKCKIPVKLEYIGTNGTRYTVKNPQEWNYRDFKFKVKNMDYYFYTTGASGFGDNTMYLMITKL